MTHEQNQSSPLPENAQTEGEHYQRELDAEAESEAAERKPELRDKIETLLRLEDCDLVFAVPGEHSIIDCVNPATGRSAVYDQSLEEIQTRYPGAQIVNFDDWRNEKAAKQDRPVFWDEVTKEQYTEMLEVLPPADYNKGYSAFLVGEASDHHAGNGQPRYQAYKTCDGKCYASNRPLTRKEFREQTR